MTVLRLPKIFRLTKALLLFIVITIVGCQSDDKATIKTGPQDTLQKTLDTVLEANIQEDEPGLIIKLVRDGEVLYQRSIGMANVNTSEAIGDSTSIRLGSISKSFTALAIMKLYEQGKLTLEDSITDYLPLLDSEWDQITLHHLLTHQSGIPDFTNDLNDSKLWPEGVMNSDIVSYFASNPDLEFEPGTRVDYSNTGYVLLAEVVSLIEGVPFSDYMQREFFEPLDMTDSFIADDFPIIELNRAYNLGVTDLIYGKPFRATGSSSQFSSMTDMDNFLNALITDNIVRADTLNLMLQNYSEGLPESFAYGYGFMLNSSGPAFSHGGKNDGFRTFFLLNRETNIYLIILGNGGDYLPDYYYLMELIEPFLQEG